MELMLRSMILLQQGVANSEDMRRHIAQGIGIAPHASDWSRFLNNHAWAIVHLQAEKLITKVGEGAYSLTSAGRAWLARQTPIRFEPVTSVGDARQLLPWAEKMRSAKNSINNSAKWHSFNAYLSPEDIVELWNESAGCCAITGLPFNRDRYGQGAAKCAFAPSLDRIDPTKPYTRDNCRFVLAAVNFALNSFGDEVFDRIVLARHERIPRRVAKRLIEMNESERTRPADEQQQP
jgi:hypothetical protein